MADVIIPALGESITSGILSAWHVQDGDIVEEGQLLYELETDKITSEGMAEKAGKITLKAAVDDEVEIGAVVATIEEGAAAEATPAPEAPAAEPEPEVTPEPVAEAASAAAAVQNDAPISPAVRKIAAEKGIDPSTIAGSGKGGRVTKEDILNANAAPAPVAEAPAEPAPAAPTPAPEPVVEKAPQPAPTPAPAKPAAKPAAPAPVAKAPAPEGRTTRKKMTPLRKRIAERLVQAQQQAALLTTFNEVDMSAVMKTRKTYQDKFVDAHGTKLGFMSFFVKAVVRALKEVPGINAQIDGDELVQNHFFDIGVAVGTPKGLMVPVLRDCEEKNFAEIEKDIIGYAKAARDGKIQMSDLEGGCFTITNGGIYGSMLSTPILNPPQSGILGMHNIVQRAVVVNGEITIRPMMYLALSYDHRIVDGQEAVTFLVRVKEAIEDPTILLYDL